MKDFPTGRERYDLAGLVTRVRTDGSRWGSHVRSGKGWMFVNRLS